MGNNGVLTQASSSVEVNREAKAREEVALAWEAVESEYWGEWAKDTSKVKSDFYTAENLNKHLGDTGKVTNNPKDTYTGEKYIVKYIAKDQNQEFTFEVDNQGDVEVKKAEEDTIALLKEQTRGVILSTTQNTKLKDNKGNQIIIPADFKISTENADNGDAGNNVEEGIIIEDASGNQFVWVPVGTITRSDGSATTIGLSRYAFAEDGTATTKNPEDSIDGCTETPDNTIARKDASGNIEFLEKSKVGAAGGYYIGRFEAGEGNVCKYNVAPYTDIYRGGVENYSGALELSQGMYTLNPTLYKSDLMNSFAWDTAIYFIQQCGTASNHSTYSITCGESTRGIANTGKTILNVTDDFDLQCNIFDMAGNVYEWTTEFSSRTQYGTNFPYVQRGGFFVSCGGCYYTSVRYLSTSNEKSSSDGGYRTLLYLMQN